MKKQCFLFSTQGAVVCTTNYRKLSPNPPLNAPPIRQSLHHPPPKKSQICTNAPQNFQENPDACIPRVTTRPWKKLPPPPPPPLSKAQYKSLLLCTAGYRFYSAHVAPLAFSDSSFSSSCHRFLVLVVPLPFVVVSTVAAFCRHKSESS